MARIYIVNGFIASIAVALICSGCQMSDNKWMTALKERQKPKQNFKGFDEEEEITYWPNKSRRNKAKMTEMPSELKEKLASRSRSKNRGAEVVEHIEEGDRFRKSGQLEDARFEYEKALKLSPKNPDVHHRLAIVADKQHQYNMADEHYEAALKARPADPNLLSDLGYSQSLRGNTQKAERTLREALEIDPSHKGAMSNLGAILVQQNRQAEALAMFRQGSTSEAEAQRYMAGLFGQGGQYNRNSGPDYGTGSHAGPIVTTSNSELPKDIGSLDQGTISRLMAREKQIAQQRRYEAEQQELDRLRRLSNDDDMFQHTQYPVAQSSNRFQQGYAANGPIEIGPRGGSNGNNGYSQNNSYGNEPPRGQQGGYADQNYGGNGGYQNASQSAGNRADNRLAQGYGDFRGSNPQADFSRSSEADIQHAFEQRSIPSNPNGFQPANGYQQSNSSSNASQMATQLGLNAGPGSMFPVMPSQDGGAAATNDSAASFNNRFGGEFQQAPSQQGPQGWGPNPNANGPSSAATPTGQIEALPVIAPASPTSNWGSPTSGNLNWQSGTSATSGWENSLSSGAAGSGFDSGASLFREGQNLDQRQAVDRPQPPAAQTGLIRSGNEMSRPYNGAWPNTNLIPATPNQQRSNSRVVDNSSGYGNAPTVNGNGNRSTQSNSSQNGSLPQYPFAPGR